VLQAAQEADPEMPVVVMTAFGTVEEAVRAMKQGASDFLTKPVDTDHLLLLLDRAVETRRVATELVLLKEDYQRRYGLPRVLGEDPALKEATLALQRAAGTDATVLLLGESGTGKELFAQALHQSSPRRRKPFVRVACAALPETLLESELFGHEKGSFTGAIHTRAGRFEAADGGTLFLDEIGDISPTVQVKLLRFLEEREFERVGGNRTFKVDVRIVAATHRDLKKKLEDGSFREDLYYRLNVIEILIPPLRERPGDVPLLAQHFLRKYAEANGKDLRELSDDVLSLLLSHAWPGNVRELENAMERAVVLADGDQLLTAHFPTVRATLPDAARGGPPQGLGVRIPGSPLADLEREAILRTLASVGGSTSKAAAILDISARKIQYKLKEYEEQGVLPKDAGAATAD